LDEESWKAIQAMPIPWKNIDQGSSTTIVAAFDPRLGESSGTYLDDCQVASAAPWATNTAYAERLWALSEQLLGKKFDI